MWQLIRILRVVLGMNKSSRAHCCGKFLYVGENKFWVRGATYGAFPPHVRGDWFPDEAQIRSDFELMQAAGINSILTYTLPSRTVLDIIDEYGLKVVLNIPWFGCDYALERRSTRAQLREMIRRAVRPLRGHPAILMWCVGKELPPDIIRWHGKRATERVLLDLYKVAKDEDPESLVSYTNFPTTEYLELGFFDVCTYNVYLHTRPEFCRYLARLQHIAGEKPLVLTEFGMCSFRHGDENQAKLLDWQISDTFSRGCAGAVIFSWTDPFYGESVIVDDWGFGLVDAARNPKRSYEVASERFLRDVPFSRDRKCPRVTVVVATHNAASTLNECLSSLQQLNYPDYEVLVINDGSTDGSADVMARHPFRVIHTENCGVSAARNEGLRLATGELVAYIDSDAYADRDWLSFIVNTLVDGDFVAVGGPNLLPPDDGLFARCVYRSPGGPTHVMLNDESAEHIPGCNMVFRKAELDAVGGFDPIFRAAGDDVDVCWRLLAQGHQIGYSPAAVVWHHRRSSVWAYWRQQVGYGLSESLLERKHANKFNRWGDALWEGRIYSPYPFFRVLSQPLVYHGLWGTAPFQSLYDPGGQSLLARLPRAPVWFALPPLLLGLSLWNAWMLVLLGIWVLYSAWYAFSCAAKAELYSVTDRPGLATRGWLRCTVAMLHIIEPIARVWGRLKGGLTPWRQIRSTSGSFPQTSKYVWDASLPSRIEKEELLWRMTRTLLEAGAAVHWNGPSDAYDLRVRRGATATATISVVVQQHEGPSWRARFRVEVRPSWSIALLAACLLISMFSMVLGNQPLTWAVAAILICGWSVVTAANQRLSCVIRRSAVNAIEAGDAR